MEIIRHPGFVEIKLENFFSLNPRTDNLSRTFTAVQPGTTNLLLDISDHQQKKITQDESDIRHGARMLCDALNAMTDSMEMIAILTKTSHQEAARPYQIQLEQYGFRVRLFDDRNRALSWLGSGINPCH